MQMNGTNERATETEHHYYEYTEQNSHQPSRQTERDTHPLKSNVFVFPIHINAHLSQQQQQQRYKVH